MSLRKKTPRCPFCNPESKRVIAMNHLEEKSDEHKDIYECRLCFYSITLSK